MIDTPNAASDRPASPAPDTPSTDGDAATSPDAPDGSVLMYERLPDPIGDPPPDGNGELMYERLPDPLEGATADDNGELIYERLPDPLKESAPVADGADDSPATVDGGADDVARARAAVDEAYSHADDLTQARAAVDEAYGQTDPPEERGPEISQVPQTVDSAMAANVDRLGDGAEHWPPDAAGNVEAEAYGRAEWDDYLATLPDSELAAVRNYSREPEPDDSPDQLSYKDVQNQFRFGGERPGVDHEIENIDKVLDGHPVPADVVVSRGCDLDHLGVPPMQLKGRDITEPGFLSTSLGTTADFARNEPYQMHLRVPEGTPGVYIGDVSAAANERELLLTHGLVIHVDDVVPDARTGQWHVFGRVLPKES